MSNVVKLRPRERDIHKTCKQWIDWQSIRDKRYAWFWHTPNGEKRDDKTAALLKAMGVRSGIPDFLNPTNVSGYHGLAIELKKPGEKPTKEQFAWMSYFRACGWFVVVCQSVDEFISACRGYFGEKP